MYKKFLRPLLSGRAIIVKDNKLLLISENRDYWVVPGGIADEGETVERCIERETLEETGLVVEVDDILYVTEFLDSKYDSHKIELFFKVNVISGQFREEIKDPDGDVTRYLQFFSLEEIRDKIRAYPEFLKLGEWLDDREGSEIYKGVERR